MSIVSIRAAVECDECGRRFKVDLEEAYQPPAGWSLFDCAVDAVRGGVAHDLGEGSTSVQSGRALCVHCTREADAAPAAPPTADEAAP